MELLRGTLRGRLRGRVEAGLRELRCWAQSWPLASQTSGQCRGGWASTSWGPPRAMMSTEGSQCQLCLGWTNPGSNPDSTTNQLCNPGQAT